jgi:hypothetical protein
MGGNDTFTITDDPPDNLIELRPRQGCTSIGGAQIDSEESGVLAIAAGGNTVLEFYSRTGEIKVFGEEIDVGDPDFARQLHEALRKFLKDLLAQPDERTAICRWLVRGTGKQWLDPEEDYVYKTLAKRIADGEHYKPVVGDSSFGPEDL